MTIRSYLMFIATQPLLLRLAMVAIAALAFAAVYAIAERLLAPRTERSKSAVPEEPRRVISAAYFW